MSVPSFDDLKRTVQDEIERAKDSQENLEKLKDDIEEMEKETEKQAKEMTQG